MANLEDLLEALGKVATGVNAEKHSPLSQSKIDTGYDGEDDDDQDEDVDKEEGEDDEEEGDDDFRNPRPVMQLKVTDSLNCFDKEEFNVRQLRLLRKRTTDINRQLELDRQLKLEKEKLLQASLKLREINMTAAERKARDEEIQRGRLLFSRIIPELSPNWREEATRAFRNKKL